MATYVLKIPDWLPVRRVSWKRNASKRMTYDRQMVLQAGLMVGVRATTGRRRVDLEIRDTRQHQPAAANRYFRAAVEVLVSAGFLVDGDERHVERGDVTFAEGLWSTRIVLVDVADLPDMNIPAGDDEDAQRSDCTTGDNQARQENDVDLVACADGVGQS